MGYLSVIIARSSEQNICGAAEVAEEQPGKRTASDSSLAKVL